MRAGGVAAEGDEVVAGAVQFGGDFAQARILPVAARGVVLHVDGDDGAAGQEVGEGRFARRAVVKHL